MARHHDRHHRDGFPMLRRVAAFNAVGIMGIAVQQACLFGLTEWAGLHYLLATAGAVQLAIVHNFLWHERWTWRDRTADAGRHRLGHLTRFILVNGSLAVAGQVVFTGLYVTAFELHYSLANLAAIATCAVLSFVANDRLVFQPLRLSRSNRLGAAGSGAALLLAIAASPLEAAELHPKTLEAWEAYVALTEARIQAELASNEGFLVQDFDADPNLARIALVNGKIQIRPMQSRRRNGMTVSVPAGTIHHWRGGILIPGVTLDEVLERTKTPLRRDELQEDVLESRVLERTDDVVRVFLKLRRQKLVTVHYNTEHEMRYVRHDAMRASSRSVATKIAELEHVGTPDEFEKPVGRDRGFLWRLNSYWRYEEVGGGVIVECESITLSRGIPAVARWLVAPMIRSAATESMERTLTSMRERLLGSPTVVAVAGQ